VGGDDYFYNSITTAKTMGLKTEITGNGFSWRIVWRTDNHYAFSDPT
jgi:predicted Zn-dependent protease